MRSQGGLRPDMLVELANGQLAAVVSIDDAIVKLDANNMMAGKQLNFELEILAIEKPAATEL
jgi:FKBP-type peptidyl-prolyl cis-trans isomerase 2